MRRLAISFVIIFSSIFIVATAFAKSGSTVIPHIMDGGSRSFHLFLSNITDSDIEVFVTLFGADGQVILESAESGDNLVPYAHYQEYTEPTVGQYSISVVIGPHQTFRLSVNNGIDNHGYGVIEWVSQGNEVKALTAQAWVLSSAGGYYSYTVPINAGLPF